MLAVVAAGSVAFDAMAANCDWNGADGANFNDSANWLNWTDPTTDTHRLRNVPSLDYTVKMSGDASLYYLTLDSDNLKVNLDLWPYTLRTTLPGGNYSVFISKPNSELTVSSGHLKMLADSDAVTNGVYFSTGSYGDVLKAKMHVTGAQTTVDGTIVMNKGEGCEFRLDGGAKLYGGLDLNDRNNLGVISGEGTLVDCMGPGNTVNTLSRSLIVQRGYNSTTVMTNTELRIVDHAVVTNAGVLNVGCRGLSSVYSRFARFLVADGARVYFNGVKDNSNMISTGKNSCSNRMDVLSGGYARFSGSYFQVGVGWDAAESKRTFGNEVSVAGSGSTLELVGGDWDNSNFIGHGNTYGNSLYVTNNGVVYAWTLDVGGYRKNATSKLDVTNCFNRVYVADGGVLRASNFGVGAWSNKDCPPGPNAMVASNVVEIAKGGRYESIVVPQNTANWNNYSFLRVGNFPTDFDNTFLVDGGSVTNHRTVRVSNNGGFRNRIRVTNGGQFFQNGQMQIANAASLGHDNFLWIDKGGVVTNMNVLSMGYDDAADTTPKNNAVVVGEDGRLVCKSEFRMFGWGQRLAVSNGTFLCSSYLSMPYNNNTKGGDCALVMSGTHPSVSTYHIQLRNRAKLRFVLPPEGFSTTPLTVTGNWTLTGEDPIVEIAGIDRCAVHGGGTFKLITGNNNATMTSVFTDARLAAYRQQLPPNVKLYVNGKDLMLRVPACGTLLIIR